MELNKEDGGSRRFILCTNNENNICREVCYPRIKKVIDGANGGGYLSNVKYYTTGFVPTVLTDGGKRNLTAHSTELLCIAENTFEVVRQSKRNNTFSIYKNAVSQTAIIYDEDSIDECCAALNSLSFTNKTAIYVFSYSRDYEPEDFAALQIKFSVKAIPEAILNIYRGIARKAGKK